MSIYRENLINAVIDNSNANNWDDAVLEWDIVDCIEDETCSESCVCGKYGLRYLYTIVNDRNGNALHPIGSCCILKFNRIDLNEEISVREGMFRLLHAVEDNQFIELSPKFFTRKLITELYDCGAFDTEYNDFDGEEDYNFFLKMFSKRKKEDITYKMHKKIRAISYSSMRPYLMSVLAEKVNRKQ